MSKMSSDIVRNNNMNEAEMKVPCLVGALWLGSAGPVVIKNLLDQDGLREMNVADMECYFFE